MEECGLWYKKVSFLQTSEPNTAFLYSFHSTRNPPADPGVFCPKLQVLNSLCRAQNLPKLEPLQHNPSHCLDLPSWRLEMVSPAPLTISTAARFTTLGHHLGILDAKSNLLGAQEILSNSSRRDGKEEEHKHLAGKRKEFGFISFGEEFGWVSDLHALSPAPHRACSRG